MSILDYIIIGIVAVVVIIAVIWFVIKIVRLTPEERKKLLITVLTGFVKLAENEFKQGENNKKLNAVIKYFSEKSGIFNKILLLFTGGKKALPSLIAETVKQVQDTFRKSTENENVIKIDKGV